MISLPRRLLRSRSSALLLLGVGLVVVVGFAYAWTHSKVWRTRALLRECMQAVNEYAEANGIRFVPGYDIAPVDVGPQSSRHDTSFSNTWLFLWLARGTPSGRRLFARPPSQFMHGARPAAFWQPGWRCTPGDYVCAQAGQEIGTYLCIAALPTPPGEDAAPPNQRYWLKDTAPEKVPGPLDAWGNPVIFVPGGRLEGMTLRGRPGCIVRSPGERPFFASAGPDGRFRDSADDNVYSY